MRLHIACVLVATVAFFPAVANSQCRPGDVVIGKTEEGEFYRYYCSSRSCAQLGDQLTRDRQALERHQKNIADTNADLQEWTAANEKAASDAAKKAIYLLYDASLGKVEAWRGDRLRKVYDAMARPQGQRWGRLLERAHELESQAARLNGQIDALKLGQYPLSDLQTTWIEIRDWAAKTAREGERLDEIVLEMNKDPEGANALREAGLGLVSNGLKLALKSALAAQLTFGEFFVDYGYNALAWTESRQRIMQRIGNQEANLLATCKLSEQHKKTVMDVGICGGRYPAPNVQMPDPARCR
jgi:hypothetical protein